jgi:rod shape determining protein RodA
VGSTFVLVLFGAVNVYAATRNSLIAHGRNPHAYLERDAINVMVGLALAAPAALVDYRTLRAYAPVFYAAVMGGLLLVLSPLGSSINGAHAWFSLGPVQLEPSEFAKLAVIGLMAAILCDQRVNDALPKSRDVRLALIWAGVPIVLILAEPALGIAIIVGILAITVLAMARVRAAWIYGLIATTVMGMVAVLSLHLLKPYQEQRFTYFTHPLSATHSTVGYQIEQSKIAIGAGGFTGTGFLAGPQTNGNFIPEQQTDFVFTVTAEEGGFLACLGLLSALGVLLWRGLRIAENAVDEYGRVMAASIVAWFATQSFINIGMTLGIMPVTGLPLPFVSYGGSALFADLLAVGLLLNIHARSTRRTPRA